MDTSPDHIYPARAAHAVTEEDKEQENEESTNLEKIVGVNYDFPQSMKMRSWMEQYRMKKRHWKK